MTTTKKNIEVLQKEIKNLKRLITDLQKEEHKTLAYRKRLNIIIDEIKKTKEFQECMKMLKADNRIGDVKVKFSYTPKENKENWIHEKGLGITREIQDNNISKNRITRTLYLIRDKNVLGDVEIYEE